MLWSQALIACTQSSTLSHSHATGTTQRRRLTQRIQNQTMPPPISAHLHVCPRSAYTQFFAEYTVNTKREAQSPDSSNNEIVCLSYTLWLNKQHNCGGTNNDDILVWLPEGVGGGGPAETGLYWTQAVNWKDSGRTNDRVLYGMEWR